MILGRRGVPGERGEEAGGMVAGNLTGRLIGMAIKIHKTVGPGLFESFYEDCLALELSRGGLRFERQVDCRGCMKAFVSSVAIEPISWWRRWSLSNKID